MKKAFDIIQRNDAWKVLEKGEKSKQKHLKDIYRGNSNIMRIIKDESKESCKKVMRPTLTSERK